MLAGLMKPDHVFVDADGSEHGGREQMKENWWEFFEMVPDFQIEVSDRFGVNHIAVLQGQAGGTFLQDGEVKAENHWSIPAAWRVIVESASVAVWQIYANQHPVYEIPDRIGSG